MLRVFFGVGTIPEKITTNARIFRCVCLVVFTCLFLVSVCVCVFGGFESDVLGIYIVCADGISVPVHICTVVGFVASNGSCVSSGCLVFACLAC